MCPRRNPPDHRLCQIKRTYHASTSSHRHNRGKYSEHTSGFRPTQKSTSPYRAKRPNHHEIPESVRRLSSSSRPDNPPQAHHDHNQQQHKRPETVRDVSHKFFLQRRKVPSYRLLQKHNTTTLHHTTLPHEEKDQQVSQQQHQPWPTNGTGIRRHSYYTTTTNPPKCTPLL